MAQKFLFAVMAVLIAAFTIAPAATFAAPLAEAPYGLPDNYGVSQIYNVAYDWNPEGEGAYGPMPMPGYGYEIAAQTDFTFELDTDSLFSGVQLMLDVLSSPYMLIAGLGLGVAILVAVVNAINKLRM